MNATRRDAADLFGASESEPEGLARIAVAPAAPVDQAYDYLAAAGWAQAEQGAPLGAYVLAPFGGRRVIGVVWGAGADEASTPRAKLKTIDAVLDLPPMRAEMRRFLERAAAYTMTPLGEMVRLATRAPKLEEPAPMRAVLALGSGRLAKSTPARQRALDAFLRALAADPSAAPTPAALAREAGVGAGVVAALVAEGALLERLAPRDAAYPRLDPTAPGKPLSPEQAAAAAALGAAVAARTFSTHLLHGVTGAGKTEAYLEAVAECLRQGRQALVLLPEIALTEAFIERIAARFGARPAEWHSAASGVERRRCWRATADGSAMVVVGARSALFLPFRDLGLIVVDEEHDAGYKQEDGALYHARDLAVLRAQCEGAAVALASATPSLESWVNAGQVAQAGDPAPRYGYLRLASRFGVAAEPEIDCVDLRADAPPRERWLAPSLVEATRARLAAGEQTLLFLNRRGYAPLTLCRSCGDRLGCPHCDAWLVLHRAADRVICHLCGHSQRAPSVCPSCGKDALAACGPGVERLAEEAAELFPEARLTILSSDAAPTHGELKARIQAVAEGAVDLIIGTQIVAKGHNFPNLTLVGVVDADLGLQGGDFRAAERSFQLMRQVVGRAGRAERPGRALVQTAAPDHPVMRALAAGDERRFLAIEADERRAAGAPPFGRYLAVILSGEKEDAVWAVGAALQRLADPMRAIGAVVLGPAPAPIPRIRGKFRARLLVKAPRGARLQDAARAWSAALAKAAPPGKSGVRVAFDVDPMSFL